MIDQRRIHRLGRVAAFAFCVAAALPVCAQQSPAPNAGDTVTLRLRIEWGGGAARRWQALAEAPGGGLKDVAPLGIEADEPGSMWTDGVGWHVEPRSPRTYDGTDLTLAAPPSGAVIFQFAAADGGPPAQHRVPVQSLVNGSFQGPLDESGNRLSVRRAPGDSLRLEFDYRALIFAPGEVVEMQVRPHLLGLPPGTPLDLSATLRRARQTTSLWTGSTELTAPDDDGAWPTVPTAVKLPDVEGVYDIALATSRRDPQTGAAVSLAHRRTVQVVVLSKERPTRPTTPDPALSNVLVEIDSASPGWSERLKQMTPLSGARRTPLSNVRSTTRTIGRTAYTELPAVADPSEPAWQAFPLTVAKPGTPHVVEVEYPSDVAQSLGVSLVEPNAAGAIAPLGVDTGLYVDRLDVEPTSRTLVRRFVVWPRTASPLLVLVNQRRDASAVFGKIRLLGAAGPGGKYFHRTADVTPELSAAPPSKYAADERLLGAYYDRPLFPQNFGASTVLDPDSGNTDRSFDDWVTFYDGARRLIDYLAYSGQNGLMLTVVADGSAIYPSELLQPTPRYDDGAFFATAQDPIRKDVVELLSRLCDREGLRFVPAVQFVAPLPALEAERRGGAIGIEPLGRDGRTWRDAHPTAGGLGPRYNPLDPRVQSEMTRVVAELAERYGKHASFGGVAVQLSADGYTQVPGVEWALDAETLDRFTAESRASLSSRFRPSDAAALVVDRYRETWLTWRKETLTRFYHDLSRTATGDVSTRRLYLIAPHGWRRDDLESRLQPSLPTRPAIEQIADESGLALGPLAEEPRIHWLRPYAAGSFSAPAADGASLALNDDDGLDRFAAAGSAPGAMVFHSPQLQRLESLERSLAQPALIRLASESAAGGVAGRRQLVRSLAALDSTATFCGGWTLPLGAADDVRRVATVMRALPSERFTTLEGAPSHVVARTLSRDGRTYLYVVNDAPWPTTVVLDVVAAGAECVWESFDGDAARSKPVMTGGRRTWQATLEPYDVVGGVFLESDVSLSNVRATVPDGVAERLTAEVRRLWARSGSVQRAPPPIDVMNADFEAAATPAEPIPGWTATAGDAVRLSTNEPHGGDRSVELVGGKAEARLTSRPLPTLRCGRASISVWLRAVGKEPVAVRLSLAGTLDGQPYQRSASIGDDAGGNGPGPEWRQFVFPVHDVPTAGLAHVRVSFELAGEGGVRLDDVRVSELDFTASERLELSKLISLAEYRLQRGELGACARHLEEYWPRFLTAYVPVSNGTTGDGGSPEVAARRGPRPPQPAPTPGMRDRLKSWLPEFLR